MVELTLTEALGAGLYGFVGHDLLSLHPLPEVSLA